MSKHKQRTIHKKTMLLPAETTSELINWIQERLDEQGWSMREASIKSGMSPGRLGQIMSGEKPGIEACIKLSTLFGVLPSYVLYLAGYLDRDPSRGIPPELQTILDDLESLRHEAHYEPLLRIMRAAIDLAMFEADKAE